MDIAKLRLDIDRFMKRHGMTKTAFGVWATGSRCLYERLQTGNPTIGTLEKVRDKMREFKP